MQIYWSLSYREIEKRKKSSIKEKKKSLVVRELVTYRVTVTDGGGCF